jgi:hypothetical protein
MGMNSFAPWSQNPLCFVVTNVAASKKQIKIFNYPIMYGDSRDLLKIPGVSEESIRAGLLKGEIKHKILQQEIVVICSDIDLLQFNTENLVFLQSAGIVNGLQVSGGGGTINYAFKQKESLIGSVDGLNRVFVVPNSDKFINGPYNSNDFRIYVTHNGHGMKENLDYKVSESGGVGTGLDTITFISFTPLPGRSILEASYVIKI